MNVSIRRKQEKSKFSLESHDQITASMNGTIQYLISSFVLDARTMCPEASTLLSPSPQHPIHPRWCHMEAFRHTWLWILNQTYVLSRLPAILVRKKNIIQVWIPHPEIRHQVKDIIQLYLLEPKSGPDLPRATTRITTPVPVRSKQRATSTEDPQPKKKQRSTSGPESTTRPVSLPSISEIPRTGFNSDDSDDDAASKAHSAHDNSAIDLSRTTTLPSTTTNTTPPGTSTPLVLTPNPTIRILQPTETSRPPSHTTYRPWSDIDDQELVNLKNDTKSRFSWKTIGARLRRDPQVCKLRWGILKQTDQHGHIQPPQEPEAED